MSLKKSVGLFVSLFAVVAMMFIAGCAESKEASITGPSQNNGTDFFGCVVIPDTVVPQPPVVIPAV